LQSKEKKRVLKFIPQDWNFIYISQILAPFSQPFSQLQVKRLINVIITEKQNFLIFQKNGKNEIFHPLYFSLLFELLKMRLAVEKNI
jgi:hypothetical protein